MEKKVNTLIYLIFIALIYMSFSCSAGRFNKVMTFFFDGVPSGDSVLYPTDGKVQFDTSYADIAYVEAMVQKNDYIIHYPYQENDCSSCHDENSRSELVMNMPGLCYACHDDYSEVYNSVHGPVSSGYCTLCHNPHMSKENNLLIRTGQQLCLYCHEAKTIFQSETHKDIDDSECTLCHNPHGGEDRFLMN